MIISYCAQKHLSGGLMTMIPLSQYRPERGFWCGTMRCWRGLLRKRADPAGLVILAFANVGFVPFWYNLKCSLDTAGVHNDLLVGADNETCSAAARLRGTACVVGQTLFFDQALEAGAYDQGTLAYAQIVRLKTRPVLSALEQGFHVLFTDTDIVWLSDPRPWLLERAGLGRATSAALDILVQSDYDPSNDRRCSTAADCPRSFRCDTQSGVCAPEVCSGFYLLRAGQAALSFVTRVQALLASQSNHRSTEQWAFNVALGDAELRWQQLPLESFPNGAAYFTHGLRPAGGEDPFIVHNNWIRGAANKEARFRQHKMWLTQGHTCHAITRGDRVMHRDELRALR